MQWQSKGAKGAKGAKGGGKGGAREVLTGDRVNGLIVEWKGNHGWVQPFYPVNHPQAATRKNLFLSTSDLEEEIDDQNPVISFVVYLDSSGLGAQEVRQAGYGAAAFGGVSAHMDSWGAAGGKGGAGGHGGKGGGGGGARVRLTHEQVCEKVDGALRGALWPAIQEIAALEDQWTPEETLKRVVRYIYKTPLSDDPTKKDWSEAVRNYVHKATDCYNRACGDKAWFDQLDLGPALGAASWIIAEACEGHPRPQKAAVEQLAVDLHVAQLGKPKLDKTMWDVIQLSFPVEEKIQTKIWNNCSRTYTPAIESAKSVSAQGFQKAEKFLKAWIADMLYRTWGAFENPEEVLSPEVIVDFFRALIYPMDEESVSCIPATLLNGQERAAEEWDVFLLDTVSVLCQEYSNPSPGGKKRKAEDIV